MNSAASLLVCLVAVSLTLLVGPVHGKTSVNSSPHNLSASGPGNVTFPEETRVCVFCHVPHNATEDDPLWSRTLPSFDTYERYASSTLQAVPADKPTGASRLCLSCHDGTIGLGDFHGSRVTDKTIKMPKTLLNPKNLPNYRIPTLGFGGAQHHPISFTYPANGSALVQRAVLPNTINLQGGDTVQCTSCHDPHDNQYGKFLVVPKNPDASHAGASPLCVTCHTPAGWAGTLHNLQNGTPANKAAMAEGCISCHYVHNSPAGAVPLLHMAKEEENCTTASCHKTIVDLIVNTLPIEQKSHPVQLTQGDHAENEALPAITRHVECVDCHNPHYSDNTNMPLSNPPNINGPLKGVRRVAGGPAVTEYEICFRCHSGSNAGNFIGAARNRVMTLNENDQSIRFNSISYHPVTMDRKYGGESLLTNPIDYKTNMRRIYCSDCHNNSDGSKASGSGPNGPHASNYKHILIAKYSEEVSTPYATAQYALCFRCHDADYVMGVGPGKSGFGDGATVNEHFAHVQTRSIPCFFCHDPHGTSNAHLINFYSLNPDNSTNYPVGLSVPVPVYTSLGVKSGSCKVNCHTTGPTFPDTHSYGFGSILKAIPKTLRRAR